MTPAPFSNSDIASTNPAAPTSTSDSSMTSRAHLYPMTNIDQDRGYTGWNPQNYPYSVKPWTTPEGESASYDYSCDKDSPSGPSEQHRSQLPDRMDPSVCAAPRPSFPTTPSTYGLLSGLNGLTDLSSPTQSHDDAQWQMYLTSSLSNPLESLPFSSVQSPPSLSYPSEPVEGIMVHIPEPPPAMDQFSIPDDAMFGGLMITGSDKVHQSAFASSPSRLSSEFPHSRVHVDYNQSDIYRESDQGLPQRPAETTTNGVYASFMDTSSSSFALPSTEFTSSNVAPHLVSNLTLAPSSTSATLQDRYPILSHPSPIRPRRGLCGWNGPQSPEEPIDRAFTANVHGKRLRSVSPSPILTYRRPQSAKTTPSGGQISLARETQRSRNSNAHSLSKKSALSNRPHGFDPDSDDDGNDDGDSDDYRPSRSASPDSAFPSSYPVQFLCETGTESSGPSKKKAKRGKGKAKGSAALALAVVTQLGGTKSQDGSEQFDDDFDPLTVYSEGRHGIRKRKNHPIPLPVPIPNLNKKSRGRKVPFVADLTSSGGSTSPPANVLDDDEGPIRGSGPGRIRRKTSRMPTPVQDELAGSRSYVCVVPGCGKCFVRGEHLKRHVRSIHTHDKPHPCPYKGCDKSFSRRDNLGQHVRIHLQP